VSDQATDLKVFQPHLHYELWMLVETYSRLEAGVSDHVLANALIEAFCIHARNLDYFFAGKRGTDTATYADEYVAYGGGDDLGEGARKKLQTQIAHLTKARTADEGSKVGRVDRRKIVEALVGEAHRFHQHLKPQYKAVSKLNVYKVPPAGGIQAVQSTDHSVVVSIFRS
jgi:hypothetical protein